MMHSLSGFWETIRSDRSWSLTWRGHAARLLGVVSVAVAGVWLANLVPVAVTAVTARGWPTIPASIRSVELLKGRPSQPKERVILGSYSYALNGKTYTNSRLSPDPSGRSFDQSRLKEWHAILESHLKSGQPIDARVCPSDPSKALIFLEPPNDLGVHLIGATLLLFGGLFALVLPLTWRTPAP